MSWRVLVHGVLRVVELAERHRVNSADHARLEVEELRAGRVLATRGLVVKHVDAVELSAIAATVLAVAADAVLVAHHLQELGAHLATALTCLHVQKKTRGERRAWGAGSTREKTSGEERRNARNSVWQFDTGNRKCR